MTYACRCFHVVLAKPSNVLLGLFVSLFFLLDELPKNLRGLILKGNPCADADAYRQRCIKGLPNLEVCVHMMCVCVRMCVVSIPYRFTCVCVAVGGGRWGCEGAKI